MHNHILTIPISVSDTSVILTSCSPDIFHPLKETSKSPSNWKSRSYII